MTGQPPHPYLGVDDFVPDRWADGDIAHLDKWQQGDLIEHAGLTWIGPVGDDTVTGQALPAGDLPWAPLYSPELQARYGVVCSQTCDVGADGPGARHPFVQIAPVVDLSGHDEARKATIRRYGITHLVALTGVALDPGFWVADLRLSVSVSKAFLLRHEPVAGFATEFDRLSFAEAIALRLRRPALDGLLSHELTDSLNNYLKSRIKNASGRTGWRDQVGQVRIITSENRLQARTVTILIFEDLTLSPEQQEVWRNWLRENVRVFASKGLTIDKMLFNTLDGYTARYYKDSIPLRLTALPAPPTW